MEANCGEATRFDYHRPGAVEEAVGLLDDPAGRRGQGPGGRPEPGSADELPAGRAAAPRRRQRRRRARRPRRHRRRAPARRADPPPRAGAFARPSATAAPLLTAGRTLRRARPDPLDGHPRRQPRPRRSGGRAPERRARPGRPHRRAQCPRGAPDRPAAEFFRLPLHHRAGTRRAADGRRGAGRRRPAAGTRSSRWPPATATSRWSARGGRGHGRRRGRRSPTRGSRAPRWPPPRSAVAGGRGAAGRATPDPDVLAERWSRPSPEHCTPPRSCKASAAYKRRDRGRAGGPRRPAGVARGRRRP